ncbi:MAG: hypothetical protein AAFU60_16750, partial [Bacteroidota bacterium]
LFDFIHVGRMFYLFSVTKVFASLAQIPTKLPNRLTVLQKKAIFGLKSWKIVKLNRPSSPTFTILNKNNQRKDYDCKKIFELEAAHPVVWTPLYLVNFWFRLFHLCLSVRMDSG